MSYRFITKGEYRLNATKREFCLILHDLITQVRQDCDLEPLVLPEPVARYISEARELRDGTETGELNV